MRSVKLVATLLFLLTAGCASLEDFLIREFATDSSYQQEMAPYLLERYEEKMSLPDPPSAPVRTAPEDLDRG
jgi:hypothetical protein